MAGETTPKSSAAASLQAPASPPSGDITSAERESEVNKELRRLNRALRALSGSNQALAQATSEQELLDQICDTVVHVGGYRMCGIVYAEQDPQKTVRPVAHAGRDSGYLDEIELRWSDSPLGRGPAGTCIRENRICLIADTATDPRFEPWRQAAVHRGYASVICLPLRVAGLPFGVLAIYSEQANSFEPSEIELLSEMANNLAFGITAIRSQEESRRATTALREAEAKYRQLIEQVPAVSYVSETGMFGPFLYMSPQVTAILGYKPEQCMSDNRFWWDHLHPEDRQASLQEDTWEEGKLFQLEYRMRRADGAEVWLRDEGVVLRDPTSGKKLTRGLLVDITGRKQAEEALRRSEENYRLFVAQSSEGIFRLDLSEPLPLELPEDELTQRILQGSFMAECNDAMAKMCGMNGPKDLLGCRLGILWQAGGPNTTKVLQEYVRNGFRLVDRELRETDARGNPKVFWTSVFGIVEKGKLWRSWGIQRDITEQLKTEELRRKVEIALRESEERYRTFVRQSSEGIFRMEYDPPVPCDLPIDEQIELGHSHGYMAECNDAMARMFGLVSAHELMGKRLSEFLVLRDPVTREFMQKFIRGGYRVTDQESVEIDARGQKRIFRNTMVGTIADGRWVRTWGIARDVTERLHLEEQLRNAQQLEAIGRLAGGVAHDFNNILSILTGHCELLLASGVEEKSRSGLEQIRRAADRAASLTQQLLAFSRRQVLQPRVLDLNEAVIEVDKMLSRVIGEDIELVTRLHPLLRNVKADPGQIQQVLMNLAVNARDAMPHGGQLAMDTFNVDIKEDEARDMDLPQGKYVMLKVSDTGYGMDADTVSHIFEPFFTTKARGKGTGLGLSTVYGIVKQSGGGIRVQSQTGRGTTFRIYLPATEASTSQQLETSGSQPVVGGSETILITEDEADLRELTRIFLESYGYKVIEAGSAVQAIRKVEESDGPVHLLLTDVIMPGMSGRQLAEQVLRKSPATRILYMTGYTDDMVVQHKVLEPGVQLLQKPFTKAELALKIRTTLDGKAGR